jgi:hypothetical protein
MLSGSSHQDSSQGRLIAPLGEGRDHLKCCLDGGCVGKPVSFLKVVVQAGSPGGDWGVGRGREMNQDGQVVRVESNLRSPGGVEE